MTSDSSRKRSFLDPNPSSSLSKNPKKSSDKKQNSLEATTYQTTKNDFEEQINILDKCIESSLQTEKHNLVKSWEDLKLRYEQLQNYFPTEKTLKEVDKKYSIRNKCVKKYEESVIDVKNRATELKESAFVTSRTVTKVKTCIKENNELVGKIKKEINKIHNTKVTVLEKIDIQERKYRTRIKRQTVKGDEFQRILQVLLRQRALSCPEAEVGIEVSGVGQLDDAVYSKTKENKCRFFQMKHQTNRSTAVTAAELFKYNFDDDDDDNDDDDNNEGNSILNRTQERGNKKSKEQSGLHLLMYFKSFCIIKENPKFENWDVEEVTLITNRDIDLTKRKKGNEFLPLLEDKRTVSEKDECLDLEVRAQKYGLNVQKAKDIFYPVLFKVSSKYLTKNLNIAGMIVNEFLEKIHIVVNYPDLRDLRRQTFNEVFHEDIFCSLNRNCLEQILLYTEINLLSNKNEFTTNMEWESKVNEIKNFINGLKSVTLSDENTQSALLDMGITITFESENLNDIYEDVKDLMQGNRYQVLECMGNNYKMNRVKLLHILEKIDIDKFKWRLCKYDNLLTADFLLKSFFDDDFDLLVVICKNITYKDENLWTSLGNALQNSKKMIIVSEGNNTFTTSMKDLLKDKYLCKEYQHGYKYLTPSCKKKILSTHINFQTKMIPLEQLIKDNLANNVVDDNSLWDIIDKSKPEISLSDNSSFYSPGYSQEYYISRKFYRKRISFETLKNYMTRNIFLVTGKNGMTENEIKTVLTEKGICEKFVQSWLVQTEYENGILLGYHHTFSNDQIFNILSSSKKHVPVHSIMMNKKKHLFLIDSTEEHFAENELIDKEPMIKEEDLKTNTLGQTVILVGDSGVGKSTTLTSIAHKIRQSSTSTWVARVILRKASFLRTLENTKTFVSSDDAINCISKMIFTGEPQESLSTNLIKEGLKYSYKGLFRFVLLLDGFNEINEVLQERLIILIKTLRDHCNVHQIWITTQNHERIKLETKLEVSSYFLEPLNDKDQIILMARYWQTEYKEKKPAEEKNYDELWSDARDVIQKFKSTVNDVEKRLFTENSLNLKMLAHILFYEDYKIMDRLNFFDLYVKFVELKFSIYKKETALDKGESEDTFCTDSAKDKLYESHIHGILQQFSVKSFLNNHKTYRGMEQKLPGMDAYHTFKTIIGNSESELTLSKLGLMILKNHDFDFIHPTFAQFFLCEYLIKHICHHDCKLINKFLVQSVLSTDSFQPCRKFLDHALGKLEESKPQELQKAPNNLARSLTKVLIQKKRNSAAPIKENLSHLSLFLLAWLKEEDVDRYLTKILNQDFKSNEDVLFNIDKIINYCHTNPKKCTVELLIRLYKNRNAMEEVQSIVEEVTIKEENEDENAGGSFHSSTKMDCD